MIPIPQDGRQPVALTIAGSDSGAGAGIQADLKTFCAHGVYGCSVLALVTAQNTVGVAALQQLPPDLLRAQLDAVFSDFRVAGAKSGALGSAAAIAALVEYLRELPALPPLVVDPVMISKHGSLLLDNDAVAVLRTRLLPLASVVTPNLPEAAALSGLAEISSRGEMEQAAQRIADCGCSAVVVKGGHRAEDAADLLWTPAGALWLEGAHIDSPHTHGTGCTFSAAITAGLARGLALADSVAAAKEYVAGAIRHAQRFGQGVNPVNHFWRSNPRFGAVAEER
jgi:hydroxymethylpyrimidine/phosphomethylpyrimidine kinase